MQKTTRKGLQERQNASLILSVEQRNHFGYEIKRTKGLEELMLIGYHIILKQNKEVAFPYTLTVYQLRM